MAARLTLVVLVYLGVSERNIMPITIDVPSVDSKATVVDKFHDARRWFKNAAWWQQAMSAYVALVATFSLIGFFAFTPVGVTNSALDTSSLGWWASVKTRVSVFFTGSGDGVSRSLTFNGLAIVWRENCTRGGTAWSHTGLDDQWRPR